jgi:putative endonuclease
MSKPAPGRRGEERAAEYLLQRGYEILERNFRIRGGEIDLIARNRTLISFLEVKSWKVYDMGELERSIDEKKRLRIINASKRYLQRHPEFEGMEVRYDVIFLDGTEDGISMIQNAFMGTGMV